MMLQMYIKSLNDKLGTMNEEYENKKSLQVVLNKPKRHLFEYEHDAKKQLVYDVVKRP